MMRMNKSAKNKEHYHTMNVNFISFEINKITPAESGCRAVTIPEAPATVISSRLTRSSGPNYL